jgi:GMP synthase-like glutamine amidotransferase
MNMRFLVFQHLDVEHPGIFRSLWRRDGISWDTVELDRGETIPARLESYDALVVMGGPQDVWQESRYPWLIAEKAAIQQFVAVLRRPYLGICLGHQLLADAMGGSVRLMAQPEVGHVACRKTSAGAVDSMLSGIESEFSCFQWHGAEVDALPPGSVALAGNKASAVQALRWGDRAYGFQYHVEITQSTVGEWAAVPEYAAALEKVSGLGAVSRLAAETANLLPIYEVTSERLHRNFMGIVSATAPAS